MVHCFTCREDSKTLCHFFFDCPTFKPKLTHSGVTLYIRGRGRPSNIFRLKFVYVRSLFFRSVAHAEVILKNGDLRTNARNLKTIWSIFIL